MLALTSLTSAAGTVAAEPDCPRSVRLYAVASDTGHLTELVHCQGFQQATVVDRGDWRGHRAVFATGAGQEVTVYALTANHELLSYRQDAPSAALAPPERVGGSWADRDSVFASAPGVLHARHVPTAQVDTFIVAGTTAVRQPASLLPYYLGPTMTGIGTRAFAETNVDGVLHFRIWQLVHTSGGIPWRTTEAFMSGELPDVTGVVGTEPELFGVDGQGRVVLMRQQVPRNWRCARQVLTPWEIVDRTSESYVRVVVPATGHGVPTVADLPPSGPDCQPSGSPWEWQ